MRPESWLIFKAWVLSPVLGVGWGEDCENDSCERPSRCGNRSHLQVALSPGMFMVPLMSHKNLQDTSGNTRELFVNKILGLLAKLKVRPTLD